MTLICSLLLIVFCRRADLGSYGIAYGVNSGLLSKEEYLPVIESAWTCLSGKALQPSGLFGYCQPVGGSPEHNVSPESTSDFCVGLFTLATSQVAKLSAALELSFP